MVFPLGPSGRITYLYYSLQVVLATNNLIPSIVFRALSIIDAIDGGHPLFIHPNTSESNGYSLSSGRFK